ncbi:MAG: enoyl-CoA hydratase-related protein, partial [Thermoprotei archaeon]
YHSSVEEAVRDAHLVIEAVFEDLCTKREVFKAVEQHASERCIIASNTSNIRISSISTVLKDPSRAVGLHFFNPPVINPLVEVVRGQHTGEDVVAVCVGFVRKINKVPVVVKKDSPGFIVNRVTAPETLLFTLIVDRGLGQPAQIDAFFRSVGLPMGPYETMDYVGLDVVLHTLKYMASELSEEYNAGKELERLVGEGKLGRKTGQGFYLWKEGKAERGDAQPVSVVGIAEVLALEVNEAFKLLDEGAASLEEIDLAVKLGMNRPFGPLTAAGNMSSAQLEESLKSVYEKFGKSVFKPVPGFSDKLRSFKPGSRPDSSARTGSGEAASLRKYIEVERPSAKVAVVTLRNTEARHNPLNGRLLQELEETLKQLGSEPETRVIVVKGSGGDFSAGAQLDQMFSGSFEFMEASKKGQRAVRVLSEIPKLTIAEIEGYALGGGLELALNCDIRVASPESELGFPEITLGLVPGWTGTQRLSRLIGQSGAASMILTGERINGIRANEMGVVFRIFPKEKLHDETLRLAQELAEKVAPLALGFAKKLVYSSLDLPFDAGLDAEAAALGHLFASKDLYEGISAFFAKRKPAFKGT